MNEPFFTDRELASLRIVYGWTVANDEGGVMVIRDYEGALRSVADAKQKLVELSLEECSVDV